MNSTINLQLNHKSIRSFQDKEVPQSVIDTLVEVAQRTATSSFMQSYSIIHITDKKIKEALSLIARQPYVAQAPVLFIMVSDMYRNKSISETMDGNYETLHSFDRFFSSATDAILASQNIMIAAESLGLGGVFLGSILNDAQEVINLLNLPKFVVPVLGIGLGYPNQTPQLKPRMPKEFMYMENTYHLPDLNELSSYDSEVTTYYDLRNANKRIEAFTTQVNRYTENSLPGRKKLLDYYKNQHIIKY